MHAHQIPIDDFLVRQLLSEQFPHWANLPLRRFASSGTVHAIYQLGDQYAVRLPLLREYEDDVLREWKWVVHLAPQLPLEIPEPVALGAPSGRYPCHWLVVKWIPGLNATRSSIRSMETAARSLGRFVARLREISTDGEHIPQYRGEPLRLRDSLTRRAIAEVADEYRSNDLLTAWENALRADDWSDGPRLFHGDLHPGNLISTEGELSAVIDFGSVGTGDPSVDGIAGWWLLTESSRPAFRDAGQFDEDSWARAKGWALSIALIALPYYRTSNPGFADLARSAVNEVLSDGA